MSAILLDATGFESFARPVCVLLTLEEGARPRLVTTLRNRQAAKQSLRTRDLGGGQVPVEMRFCWTDAPC